MGKVKKKKCRHCKRLFIPNYRNRGRQKYCKNAECQKASKAASQKKWLNKSENKDYFQGPENVQRVQQWREQNPGYWKQKSSTSALQETLAPQHAENINDKDQIAAVALQDLLMVQSPVIIGLISNFIGSALQDDIAETLFRMQQSGQDILYCQPKERGGKNDCKITCFTESSA